MVNLYADRLTTVPLARTADVYSASQSQSYKDAAAKLGLTPQEYKRFRESLPDAEYVVLPRRLTAMTGIHHGKVYVVKNILLPANTWGWAVHISTTKTVFVPRVCGNLSLLATQPPKTLARTYFRNFPVPHSTPFPYIQSFRPSPLSIPSPTPVVFVSPPPVAPPVITERHSNWGLGVLLWPVAASLINTSPSVAPCSSGSNEYGICHN